MLNLTQHDATEEQKLAGVVNLPPEAKAVLRQLLTFDSVPSEQEMKDRAHDIALLVIEGEEIDACIQAMIGGAPFFMHTLEQALLNASVEPQYAFSKRESREEILADGSVRKIAVFLHAGFVRPYQSHFTISAQG